MRKFLVLLCLVSTNTFAENYDAIVESEKYLSSWYPNIFAEINPANHKEFGCPSGEADFAIENISTKPETIYGRTGNIEVTYNLKYSGPIITYYIKRYPQRIKLRSKTIPMIGSDGKPLYNERREKVTCEIGKTNTKITDKLEYKMVSHMLQFTGADRKNFKYIATKYIYQDIKYTDAE